MKTAKIFPITLIWICSFLTSCTATHPASDQLAANIIQRQQIIATGQETYPAKNPRTVAVYTNEKKPLMPYRIIGIATVSKHNLLGLPRENDTLHEMMKKLAASIGGDGLINIESSPKQLRGNVIAFQRILL